VRRLLELVRSDRRSPYFGASKQKFWWPGSSGTKNFFEIFPSSSVNTPHLQCFVKSLGPSLSPQGVMQLSSKANEALPRILSESASSRPTESATKLSRYHSLVDKLHSLIISIGSTKGSKCITRIGDDFPTSGCWIRLLPQIWNGTS
jgi:hypothetical protein